MQSDPSGPDRRKFLKTLALGSALPILGGVGRAMAQGTPPPSPVPAAPAAVPSDTAHAAPKPPELSPDVKQLGEMLLRRYPKSLTDEQIELLKPDLDRVVRIGERLRKAALKNSDEPDTIFRATPWR